MAQTLMSRPTVVEYAVDWLSKLGMTDCFGTRHRAKPVIFVLNNEKGT